MSTGIIKLDPVNYDIEQLKPAAEKLAQGGLVIFPTETVYGIGVNASIPQTVARLIRVKNSPQHRDFTYHITELDEVNKYVPIMPRMAARLAQKFWPGPLTMVLPGQEDNFIGVRLPNHPIARDLIRLSGVPVIAPSANLAGDPPATNATPAIEAFSDKVDVIIDAGPSKHGQSSTVVKITPDDQCEILRVGVIPVEEIEEQLYQMFLFVCTGNTCRSPMALGLFRHKLAEKLGKKIPELKESGYKIISGGTSAIYNAPATTNATAVLQERGYDISDHLSQPVTFTMIEEADYVYVMTQGHLTTLKEWVPKSIDKIKLLDHEGMDIDDPIGGSLDVYRNCCQKINTGVETILNQIKSTK